VSEIPHLRVLRLKAKNFKSLADVDVTLDSLTVLVGRNASGKSNILDALAFVHDALSGSLTSAIQERGDFLQVLSTAADSPVANIELGIEIGGSGWSCFYEVAFGLAQDGEIELRTEQLSLNVAESQAAFPVFRRVRSDWPELPTGLSRPPGVPTTELALPLIASLAHPSVAETLAYLRSMTFFDLNPEAMRELPRPEPVPRARHPLASDGRNLTMALRSILREQHETFQQRIVQPLHAAMPDIVSIKLQAIGRYWVARLLRSHTPDRSDLTLANESQGTLRFLAVLVALAQAVPNGAFVALEEPENTLHPAAAGVLADAIAEATMNCQVVITTHSPELLDHFPAESIRVVGSAGGETSIGFLAADQGEAIRSQLFYAGELMRMEGLRSESAEQGPSEQAS
jgi:predicted ATPase